MIKNKFFNILLIVFSFLIFIFFSFKAFSEMRALMFNWIIVLSGFALVVGILNLTKRHLTIIFEKKDSRFYYSLIVLISMFSTIFLGLFNFYGDYFHSKEFLNTHPVFLKTMINNTIRNDEYLSNFPAKKQMELIVAGMLSTVFVPTESDLKSAGFSLKKYQSFFDKFGKIKRETLEKDFLKYDVEKMFLLSNNVRESTVFIMKKLSLVKEKLDCWLKNSRNKKRLKNFFYNKIIFTNSAKNLKKILEENKNPDKRHFLNTSSGKKIIFYLQQELKMKFTSLSIKTYLLTEDNYSVKKGFLRWVFNVIIKPLHLSIEALLIFFILSAMYKSFIFSSIRGFLFLLTSIIIMLSQMSPATIILKKLSMGKLDIIEISNWILTVPNVASRRAMLIGIGIGVVHISFKILTGKNK